jgi:nitrate reductase delta subunit
VRARIGEAIAEIGRLLQYPAPGYGGTVEALAAAIGSASPEAARHLADFGGRIGGLMVGELQELFTRTFDLNPLCALEIGWHLYGEDYARGAFLVRLRQALRRHGIDEGGELPDHLATVLALLPRLDPTEAGELAATAVRPALARMRPALARAQSPFEPLLDAIDALLGAWATEAQMQRPDPEAPLAALRPEPLEVGSPRRGFRAAARPAPPAPRRAR